MDYFGGKMGNPTLFCKNKTFTITWMAKINYFDANLIQQLGKFGRVSGGGGGGGGRLAQNAQLVVGYWLGKHYVQGLQVEA